MLLLSSSPSPSSSSSDPLLSLAVERDVLRLDDESEQHEEYGVDGSKL